MEKLLEGRDFELLHAHEPCTPSVSGSAVLVADRPVVGTFHAAGRRSVAYKLLMPIATKVVDNITVRIAVSEAAREFIDTRFPGDYRIIPNGVNIEAYVPARARARIPGRILFVGRAEPRKGLFVLLEAFSLVRQRIPRASLVIVGSELNEVKDAAAKIDPRPKWPLAGVSALGRVPQDTKVDEMGAAEVIAVPSLEGESFGIVLTEALAAGLPVVASDLPAYRSVLQGGALGRLVAVGDPAALAEELVTVLQQDGLRRELIEKGIAAVEEFSWEVVVDQVIEAYDEALARAPAHLPRSRSTASTPRAGTYAPYLRRSLK